MKMLTNLSTLQSFPFALQHIRKYNLRLICAAGCRGARHMAANAARAMMLAILAAVAAPLGSPSAEPSRKLTRSEYTSGIEGPAVDAGGTLYVVNFGRKGTIGKLSRGATRSKLFGALPADSVGNGIRFDREGRMYVADYKNHNVFVFERGQPRPSVYFHSDGCSPTRRTQLPCFNQPNDLAIAADGTLYASDPNFRGGTGQIWRITRGPDGQGRGEVMSSQRQMGVTNGLDLSP